ncbi:uncharacterized protein LOC143277492 [Babylonia areolata]|uniref:uncharacterized protein LOC143277492 n=1 Tax=Babylonia areolata TaxID=304850 RepID=UPI003FD20CA0
MQGLVVLVTLAVIGLSVTDAFPKKRDSNRPPNCNTDPTLLVTVGESGEMDVKHAACNCSYNPDEYQEGSSMNTDWFQNKKCGNMSFLDLVIGPTSRRAWEMSCQCATYTLPSANECIFSVVGDRWAKCIVLPNIAGPAHDDTYCSEIEYEDGSKSKVSVWCTIPGDYDWIG